MDPSLLPLMQQMLQMGIQPQALLQQMLRDNTEQGSFHTDSPPAFRPDMSPSEIKERIQQYKEWVARDSLIGPQPAPSQSREALLLHHAMFRQQVTQDSDGKITMGTTVVGYEKHHSTTPLEHLERRVYFHRSLNESLVRREFCFFFTG